MTETSFLRRISATAAVWALAGTLIFGAWSRAEKAPEKPRRMENRFLFVVDTSSAMRPLSNGVQEAVSGLLASGMKGELRKGDTIGLWTYGDGLNTDFPMLVWSEEKKDVIAKQVSQCVDNLRYEKRSHLEKVLPEIGKVAAGSQRLTVILIFDGGQPITGMAFDKDINDLHKEYARKFRLAHEPFVTVLAARDGVFFDYTINHPIAVNVPHTADPLPPPETNAPPVVAAAPPPPPPVAVPPPHRVEIVLAGSNFTHNAAPPPPAVSNVAAAVAPAPEPAPVVVATTPAAVAAAPVEARAAKSAAAPPEPERKPPPSAIVQAPVVSALASNVALAPAAVVAGSSAGQQAAMFIMAFSLLTIAVVLVLFLVRRRRAGSQPSLISQSIDRTR